MEVQRLDHPAQHLCNIWSEAHLALLAAVTMRLRARACLGMIVDCIAAYWAGRDMLYGSVCPDEELEGQHFCPALLLVEQRHQAHVASKQTGTQRMLLVGVWLPMLW